MQTSRSSSLSFVCKIHLPREGVRCLRQAKHFFQGDLLVTATRLPPEQEPLLFFREEPLLSNEQLLATREAPLARKEQPLLRIEEPLSRREPLLLTNGRPLFTREAALIRREQLPLKNVQALLTGGRLLARKERLLFPIGQPSLKQQAFIAASLRDVFTSHRCLTAPCLRLFFPVIRGQFLMVFFQHNQLFNQLICGCQNNNRLRSFLDTQIEIFSNGPKFVDAVNALL